VQGLVLEELVAYALINRNIRYYDSSVITVGIHGGPRGSHEPGVALVVDGKVKFALQEERLNRFKSSISCFPIKSLNSLVENTGISIEEVYQMCFAGETYDDMKLRWPSCVLHNFGSLPKKFVPLHHQVAHATSGFYTSGLDDSLLVSLDGLGDRTCGLVARGRSETFSKGAGGITPLTFLSDPLKQSIGFFWALVTQLIGYEPLEESYKTMVLACYGKPTFPLECVLDLDSESGFPRLADWAVEDKNTFISKHPTERVYKSDIEERLGFTRRVPGQEVREQDADLAASAQLHLENVILAFLSFGRRKQAREILYLAAESR